jgi:hypothetical protein
MAIALSSCAIDLLIGFIESSNHYPIMYLILNYLYIFTAGNTTGREPILLSPIDFDLYSKKLPMANPEDDSKKDPNLPLPESSRSNLETTVGSKALTIAFHSVTGSALSCDIFDHLVVVGFENNIVVEWNMAT